MFKMEHDSRILGSGEGGTKKGIGWFIRTTSLGEFPQFWNILKGDMSLVGDRIILGHTKKKPVFMRLSVA